MAGFLLTAWLNEWIVSGKLYREGKAEAARRAGDEFARSTRELDLAQKEIEYWRTLAMTSLGHAEKAVDAAARLALDPKK